jgi:fatty acid desaturase
MGGSSIALIAFFPNQITSLVVSAALLGLAFQQSGWFAHDILHHQFFQNRWIGNAAGYIVGNVFQGFSVGWVMRINVVETKALYSPCCTQCSFA